MIFPIRFFKVRLEMCRSLYFRNTVKIMKTLGRFSPDFVWIYGQNWVELKLLKTLSLLILKYGIYRISF
jgi:hypothetical protein